MGTRARSITLTSQAACVGFLCEARPCAPVSLWLMGVGPQRGTVGWLRGLEGD